MDLLDLLKWTGITVGALVALLVIALVGWWATSLAVDPTTEHPKRERIRGIISLIALMGIGVMAVQVLPRNVLAVVFVELFWGIFLFTWLQIGTLDELTQAKTELRRLGVNPLDIRKQR